MHHCRQSQLVATLLFVGMTINPGWALEPASRCGRLTAAQKAEVQAVLASVHPYACCDRTLAECLAQKTVCPLVRRLSEEVCRFAAAGKGKAEISRELSKRAQSMMQGGPLATFDLDNATRAGAPEAPVQLVVYACARCPFCSVLVPVLHHEVTEGGLKGKVHLYFRPFPIKSHPGALEGGLAMLSASRLGRFWPFIIALYRDYHQFCPKLLPEWFARLGGDRGEFERGMSDTSVRAKLGAAKREGVQNQVTATPTLFINGRKYLYEMTPEAVTDVLEEEYERVSTTYKPEKGGTR